MYLHSNSPQEVNSYWRWSHSWQPFGQQDVSFIWFYLNDRLTPASQNKYLKSVFKNEKACVYRERHLKQDSWSNKVLSYKLTSRLRKILTCLSTIRFNVCLAPKQSQRSYWTTLLKILFMIHCIDMWDAALCYGWRGIGSVSKFQLVKTVFSNRERDEEWLFISCRYSEVTLKISVFIG